MSSKDNAALHQLLGLLESRYAIRVMWALKDGHPQTFRLLQDSVGGITPNTLNTRLKELRAALLVTHGSDGYTLTGQGTDLVKRIHELGPFATKWAANQSKKKSSDE
jgi:DNA-binding HxlR family transcriptional regulator